MESKFIGIPLVIWFLLLGLVALVNVPAFMWHNATSDQLAGIEYQLKVKNMSVVTPSIAPTATPSAVVSPTHMQFNKVFISPAVTASPSK